MFYSEYAQIKSRVPRGIVLRPLLFALYTFDFAKYINNCNLHLYADNVQLYLSSSMDDVMLFKK